MAAMRAVDADYAGIDLIRTAKGELQVLEVNSNPAWRGLQSVADVNIAWAIAEDFLKTVVAHRAAVRLRPGHERAVDARRYQRRVSDLRAAPSSRR